MTNSNISKYYKNILNFSVGFVLGAVSLLFWNSSNFLFYALTIIESALLFVVINWGDL